MTPSHQHGPHAHSILTDPDPDPESQLSPHPQAGLQLDASPSSEKQPSSTNTAPSACCRMPPSSDPSSSPITETAIYKSLSWLDRLLALWILLAIIVGILLGNFVPGIEAALQHGQVVDVSVPIAVGLLVMMYPILCRVRFETLHEVFRERGIWVQLGFSVGVNWILAPFFMLGLAWAFLPDQPGLRSGLILVGLARCIAMVLIWTSLAGGSTSYCAILVALNSLLQLVLFAPIAVLFVTVIGDSDGDATTISYSPVATSVGLFLGLPLGAALLTRLLRLRWQRWYDNTLMPLLAPWSLIGLLYTVVVLFAAQGQQVVHQIVSVVRVAAPLVVYFVVIFGATLLVARRLGFGYELATAQAFTAASNNFELAIAVAASEYGAQSDEALASTVGPLIEVPVLLGLVYAVRWGRRRGWWGKEGDVEHTAEAEVKDEVEGRSAVRSVAEERVDGTKA